MDIMDSVSNLSDFQMSVTSLTEDDDIDVESIVPVEW